MKKPASGQEVRAFFYLQNSKEIVMKDRLNIAREIRDG